MTGNAALCDTLFETWLHTTSLATHVTHVRATLRCACGVSQSEGKECTCLVLWLLVQQPRSGVLVCVHTFFVRGGRCGVALLSRTQRTPFLRGNSQRPAACKVPYLCVACSGSRASCSHHSRTVDVCHVSACAPDQVSLKSASFQMAAPCSPPVHSAAQYPPCKEFCRDVEHQTPRCPHLRSSPIVQQKVT